MVHSADGSRRLAVAQRGLIPRGSPVFYLHGTPGSRVGPLPKHGLLYRLGIRLITYDRPGYGDSDRQVGRQVGDVASDVATIADRLGLDRFAVVGRSGGGPHALACAALLGDRVTRAAVLVGRPRTARRGSTGSTAWPRATSRNTSRRWRDWRSSRRGSSWPRRRSRTTPWNW
ncbi:alpha/beta fold hydrolase [Nonomuraea fuscirosea]|uniref:alpha/beta fold hydrolase n=1 Tax=Nonomuraea fuscirosea TaxID=1291556 RepID=UPI00342F4A42